MADRAAALLRAARRLLGENGEHWITGRLAVDAEGEPTPPNGECAVGWCALGAMLRAMADAPGRYSRADDDRAMTALYRAAAEATGVEGGGIAAYNDAEPGDWPRVEAWIGRAIALAEA